jgi:DNA topoisomerase IB
MLQGTGGARTRFSIEHDGKNEQSNRHAPMPQAVAQARRQARQTGLIYVSDAEPGIERCRRGKGYSYNAPSGKRVTSQQVLARIRQLAIPPACKQVSAHARVDTCRLPVALLDDRRLARSVRRCRELPGQQLFQ